MPIAGLALLPLVFGFPIIFSPIHIAFLEMVIDPGLHVGLRGGNRGRRCHAPSAPAAVGAVVLLVLDLWSVLQGVLVLALTAAFSSSPLGRHAGGRGAGPYLRRFGSLRGQPGPRQLLLQLVAPYGD